ncbi:hypothetical protein P6O07_001837 [Escherichia coli]|nr:hypothetical protein [Escherichia coli]EIL3959070.1 hypothetical protein [Escherichia coli]EKE9040548.1 hypothetical protein [Escherichia coli]EKL8248995.1 hypothetical protein [Escherichia coli]EKQ6557163.1 hypothetical protein [Escherichia coli]
MKAIFVLKACWRTS